MLCVVPLFREADGGMDHVSIVLKKGSNFTVGQLNNYSVRMANSLG